MKIWSLLLAIVWNANVTSIPVIHRHTHTHTNLTPSYVAQVLISIITCLSWVSMSSLLQSSRISFLSTTPVVQIYCNSFFITSNPVITCLGEGVIGGSVAIKIDNYIYMRHIILISTLGFSIAVSVHVCVVGWSGLFNPH